MKSNGAGWGGLGEKENVCGRGGGQRSKSGGDKVGGEGRLKKVRQGVEVGNRQKVSPREGEV